MTNTDGPAKKRKSVPGLVDEDQWDDDRWNDWDWSQSKGFGCEPEPASGDEDWDDWSWDGDEEGEGEEEEVYIPLTQRTNIGGWAAKWMPGEFDTTAQGVTPAFSQESHIGLTEGNDCAILHINENQATAFFVDWFTPMVDDEYEFGAISAASAMNGIYATGAKPMTALNIMALPCKLGVDSVGAVMRGGSDVVIAAGAFVVGGHSIDDADPKYGLAVFGTAHPDDIIRNENVKPGDVLYCSKPLGTGIMNEAFRAEAETAETMRETIDSMMELSRPAAEAMAEAGIHGALAISGYGLVGELHKMLETCGAAAVIDTAALPAFERTAQRCKEGYISQRGLDNAAWANAFIEANALDEDSRNVTIAVLCDPQTSGGLVIAVPAENTSAFERAFEEKAGRKIFRIGEVVEGTAGQIALR